MGNAFFMQIFFVIHIYLYVKHWKYEHSKTK